MIANILGKSSPLSLFATAALGLATLSLSGCSLQPTATPSPTLLPAMHGTVMGGETPIAGSSLILWETDPNNTGYGLAATQLATTTGSTPGGNFSFTTGYTCAPGSFVYLTSTGGDVSDGAPTPIINNNAVLIAALGSCSNFSNATQQGSVSVIINELSTVAAAYTLDNFMSISGAPGSQIVHISASGNNGGGSGYCIGTGSTMGCTAAGLDHAFANAANLVADSSLSSGGASGQAYTTVPGNTLGSVPQAEINTLADILQYCVNSPGGVATDGSPCGTLFADATPPGGTAPTDTLSALVDIARFPRTDTSGLFGIVPGTPAFVPTLIAAPHDWSLAIAYSGTNLASFGVPQYLTLDADDNVYIETSNSYTGTTLGLAAMTSNGTGLWNNAQDSSLCVPGSLATDTNGYVWLTVDATSTSPCIATSGIYGYSAAAGGAAAYTFLDVTPYNIQNEAYAVSFDRLNNLWYGRRTSTCSSFCLGELPYTAGVGGAPGTYSGPTNVQTTNAVVDVDQIQIDAGMNIWVGNEVTGGTGTLYVLPNTSPTTPDTPIYPATPGFITQALPSDDNGGISLDAAGNVWSGSNSKISEFTPTTSSGVVNSFGAEVDTATASTKPYIGEVDGNGIYWYGSFSTSGDIFYQITPGSTLYSATAADNTSDIQPCYAPNGTTSCNVAATLPSGLTAASGDPKVVQVDSTGALWVAALGASGGTAGFVLQVFGQANPTWPQLSYGVFATKPH